uniref:CD248 molecule, endosialin a n=1 Tax=Monopterus albus TaxID=43700 RepID=A0A3Q3KLC1_MONAL
MLALSPSLYPLPFSPLPPFSSVLGQDLRERDALCNAEGCFVVYFQRKTFLDSWRACKENDGNLATIKRKEDATTIATLFSTLDLSSRLHTKVQVWIGLQRPPRQCATTRLLRGFSWTTGDQDTEYINWQKEDSPSLCSAHRCVVIGYSIQEQDDNLKWLDGPCSVPVDGYLCHYAYEGMCPALWNEGAGNALYTTPFNLVSSLLTHVPFGSVATVPCPADTKEEQSVLCMLREDGSVGWSKDSPLCSDPTRSHNWCDQNNGGCEHFCRLADAHFYCECGNGYQLGDDGQSCELSDVCQGAPCEFECLPLSDGYRCACPEGYMLAPDERGCLDVDECLQSPCEHVCVNAQGTFKCQCRKGYHLDEEGGCEDLDECINEPCEHACENTPGSHICHCHLGFSPVPEDPSKCQDTDECQFPRTCQQMCVNYDGGFECYCKEGYELMSDHFSCQKTGEEDNQSAVTPPYPWVTHQPGSVWESMDYGWTHTDWPPEEEQPLDWLTDQATVINSDVIWVTSAPHEEVPLDTPEQEVLPNTIYTSPPTTSSSPTPDFYEEDKEETTAFPFPSTSTVSEGAWNWWAGSTASSQKPEDSVINHNMPTDATSGVTVDSVQEDRGQKQSSTWLLVGLLVPICLIIVVIVAVGIFYCTRYAVHTRNKTATDCYHWISGAHDKQGAANPSAGVKNHV